jgi:prophage antirepressor-like protein
MKLQTFENELLKCKTGIFINNHNEIFFRAKDVANILTYENTTQFINHNMDDDDKYKLEELWNDISLTTSEKNSIYINESGLYSLITRSTKDEAKIFKKWIISEVLPSIRKTGKYATTLPTNNQISIMNEKDLHYNIIKFIKNIIDEPIIIAGLGEHQTTTSMRCDAFNKGYQSGQPDILLLNYHKYFNGLAI